MFIEKEDSVKEAQESEMYREQVHHGSHHAVDSHEITHPHHAIHTTHEQLMYGYATQQQLPHEHMSLLNAAGDAHHPSSKEGQFDAVFTILILAILCSSLIFVGYYMPGIPIGTGTGQVLTREGFLDSVRLNGGYATTVGPLNVSLFSVGGTVHTINKDQIIVFEYKSGSDVNRDAARISANGSYIDGKQYAWQAAPHFYKSGRVLVLYLGSNQQTLALLSYVLGQPFIGAPISFTTACSLTNRCVDGETCVAFIGDTLCLKKDPCTLCGDGYSCKKIGSYPVEVICSR